MTFVVEAVYEGGVLRPLDSLQLPERQRVQLTIEPIGPRDDTTAPTAADDPLRGLREPLGISDLAARFDECRLGERP